MMLRKFRRQGTAFVHDDEGGLLDDWGPVGQSPQQRMTAAPAPRVASV